jgi:carotenoid cleavage dioxygenase-like enzyme
MLLLVFTLSILSFSTAFLHFNKNVPFLIKYRELKKEIIYDQSDEVVNQLSGFYGLIGPDIDKFSIKTLYDLFTGDGIIQGVFFDKGNITFVKHFVRTEKILYEEQYGRFSKKVLMTTFYILMHKLKMLPNVLGLANTALLDVGTKTLALFERDLPYEIDIDFINKSLRTVKKININGLEHFSGHSKYIDNMIHTIDYDVLSNTVSYITLNESFYQMNKAIIKTAYIPIVHDFMVLNNKMIFIDSPFTWNPFSQIPVTLSNQPTYIHVYNTITNTRTQYEAKSSFYLFHYADVIETNNTLEIYGSQYDTLDFSSLNIQGKYRKIVVNLKSGIVFILKNTELENMNLDFPLKWKEYTLLRSIENQVINGFVLCKGLDIVKKIQLPNDRFFCGEPSIVEVSGSPFLIGFSYDSFEKGYLIMFELFTQKYIEIPLDKDIKLNIGFHSIFLHNYLQEIVAPCSEEYINE